MRGVERDLLEGVNGGCEGEGWCTQASKEACLLKSPKVVCRGNLE